MKTSKLSAFLIAPALLIACGSDPDEDALIDESAALALVSEDGTVEESTGDALAGMSEDEMGEAAEEAVDTELDEEPGEAAITCDFSAIRERVRARFDADGDGVLDETERAALREELEGRPRARLLRHRLLDVLDRRPHFHVWARIRWAFDVDGDGQLSAEERTAMREALEARCERRRAAFLENHDSDGDGRISPAELAAALQQARAAFQARRAQILAEYDANGDGVLDETERAALRADRRARIETRRDAVRAHFDADGNGVLDEAEREALKAAIRQRIAEGVERAF